MQKTIRGFILTVALGVSVVLFIALYLVVSTVYDRTVREDARHVSDVIAEQTFNSMFQVMRQGWTRQELEEFIEASQATFDDTPYHLEIYRGEVVEARFGRIEQPEMDVEVEDAFASGEQELIERDQGLRYLYPLNARKECLECHTNAEEGDTLGVIEVEQDLEPVIRSARDDFLTVLAFLAPLPVVGALGVGLYLNRRIKRALGVVEDSIERVNKVSDLKEVAFRDQSPGFAELDHLLDNMQVLVEKLRGFAVDRDLLEFEIRLLEKFVITSEVVRDWREYVSQLLLEINQIVDAYSLFSVFKVDEEVFDLEVFWRCHPPESVRQTFEDAVFRALADEPHFQPMPEIQVHHHVAETGCTIESIDPEAIEVQTKSLLVETPKIGGIVGIGVQADIVRDDMRMLVVESILSTLLNVVGSVKAIYKYTRDLEYYATRDPLTDLYNQRVFWELLEYEMGRAERGGYGFAVLVIDLDNFKAINDTYGHGFGDRFLATFAERLRASVRQGDVLARYGGDEFVAILGEGDDGNPYQVAERIREEAGSVALTAPDGREVHATISIGVAFYPEHATELKDLFMFADNMMYKAKTEGKNRIGYPTDEDVVEVFRAIGEKSRVVQQALDADHVVPVFQPIVEAATGRVVAHETLSRIRREDGTLMGAGEFVEVAERMGIIHKLDHLMMEKAFARMAETDYQGLLFINLSPRVLVLGEFLRETSRLVEAYGIDPGRVVFELTERDTVRNFQVLEDFVNDLKLEGFKFAIDDFGSGFSSYHYIKRFPVDYVKIEGDFIVNMLSDGRDRAFVRNITNLAQELGIRTIAEFVESDEVLNAVAGTGIDLAQGFYTGRPSETLSPAEGEPPVERG
ncbi:MAG: putative bifunctional diguanylate cyclase/phosphodiesterase [Thiohalospira sp.]